MPRPRKQPEIKAEELLAGAITKGLGRLFEGRYGIEIETPDKVEQKPLARIIERLPLGPVKTLLSKISGDGNKPTLVGDIILYLQAWHKHNEHLWMYVYADLGVPVPGLPDPQLLKMYLKGEVNYGQHNETEREDAGRAYAGAGAGEDCDCGQ